MSLPSLSSGYGNSKIELPPRSNKDFAGKIDRVPDKVEYSQIGGQGRRLGSILRLTSHPVQPGRASTVRFRIESEKNPPERDKIFQQGISLETKLKRGVIVMPRECAVIDSDDSITILRTRIHGIIVQRGVAPLAKAHEMALNTFKEFDAEWDAYLKEQARLQSLREGDLIK